MGPPEESEGGQDRPVADGAVTRWLVVLTGAVFVLAIGSPLLGLRVFHGADMLLDRSPWRTTPLEVRVASNPIVGDTVSTFMPLHAEIRRRLASGDLPLWTAYPAGGLPLATVPDAGTFGPLNLPYRILPLWLAPGIAKLLEMVAAAGVTFLFLRRIGLGRSASVTGGLVFALSGFQVVWTNWPQSHVGALIPALFWAVERGLQDRSLRGALPVAAVLAAMVFEGFPSVTGYAVLAAGAYALVRSAGEPGLSRGARVRTVLLLGSAAVLGLGLAAPEALPLTDRIGELDLGYRVQSPDSHLPPSALATLALPNAFGSPADDTYVGPSNYVEIQSFIGATSLVLVVAGAAWPGSRTLPRGVRSYLWVAVALVVILLYVGGPVLAGFQLSSLFRLNYVGRLRAVLGFLLAVLAAIGLDAVVGSGRRDRPHDRTWLAPVVWASAVVLGLVGLWRAWVLTGWGVEPLLRWGVPVAAALLTAGAVWMSRRGGRRLVVVVAPAVFAVEALLFAVPFWPRIPRDEFYPTTAAHIALERRLGGDRMVGAGGAFFPGTTTFYGIRSLTTNNTLPQLPAWEDLLTAADPDAFDQSPVFPSLAPRPDVAASPVLDRMAVRYFMVPPNLPVFGRREVVTDGGEGTVELAAAGGVITASLPGWPIRAVLLKLIRPPQVPPGSRVVARLLDPKGRVAGGGFQLLTDEEPSDVLQIPVTQPCGSLRCPRELSLELRLTGAHGELILDADREGPPAISVVTDPGDGLHLELVEKVLGYRRLHALPRIRWAGTARMEDAADERVRILREGVPPEEVLLSHSGPGGSGEAASIQVVEDSGDRIRVRVSAEGSGYLVIADPLQHGWEAAVDGRRTPLRHADHAVVAVFVPGGSHYIDLRYHPDGWVPGLAISGLSLLTVLTAALVLGGGRRADRRRETRPPWGRGGGRS